MKKFTHGIFNIGDVKIDITLLSRKSLPEPMNSAWFITIILSSAVSAIVATITKEFIDMFRDKLKKIVKNKDDLWIKMEDSKGQLDLHTSTDILDSETCEEIIGIVDKHLSNFDGYSIYLKNGENTLYDINTFSIYGIKNGKLTKKRN